jgi:glycosyltransferase involved in cell wall biosynthesis
VLLRPLAAAGRSIQLQKSRAAGRHVKKVLVYKSDLLPYSETFIREQVKACRTFHPVLVGTHGLDNGLPLDGVDVRYLRGVRAGGRYAEVAWKLLREAGLAPPGVVRRLRAEQAELVHVHFATEAVAMWPALRRLGLPVLITLHGADINTHRAWWESPGRGPFSRHYPQRLLAMSQHPDVHFIAVSHAVRDTAIAYGIPAEKVHVRYIGIDLQRFRPGGKPVGERGPRILYVGRMVEKKGGQHLIDAFAAVRAKVPQAELVMVGDGPLMDSFRARAEQLGVPVQWMGRQPSDIVRREFEQASVFCLPSITAENGDAEGLPIVVMEAQACGVPVVTSARGGATEGIIHGETGLAFGEGDVRGLTAALLQVLNEPGLAQRMSEAAVPFARGRFDIGRCTALLEQDYADWARRHRPATDQSQRPAA